jgi:superoxide reductase
MTTQSKFYRCDVCGNLVYLIDAGGGTLVCCDRVMDNLVADSTDASVEKHVPVVTVAGNIMTIKVGEIPHPMLPEHHIEWVFVEGARTGLLYYLKVDELPEITVMTSADEPLTIYSYCNIHGLWSMNM